MLVAGFVPQIRKLSIILSEHKRIRLASNQRVEYMWLVAEQLVNVLLRRGLVRSWFVGSARLEGQRGRFTDSSSRGHLQVKQVPTFSSRRIQTFGIAVRDLHSCVYHARPLKRHLETVLA